MAVYTIKCQDGGDSQCEKTLKVDIPINNLSEEQLNNIVEEDSCRITREQMKENGIEAGEEDMESLNETDLMTYKYEVDSICSACGSDYTRDDDGNIID